MVGVRLILSISGFTPCRLQRVVRRRSVSAISIFCFLAILSGNADAASMVRERRATLNDWYWDPVLLLSVSLLLWLYWRGWIRVLRSKRATSCLSGIHRGCFLMSIALVVFCLLSPLDLMSSQLASAHMVQHAVLMTVAAPLMVLGSMSFICFAGLPIAAKSFAAKSARALSKTAGDPLANPFCPWMIYAAVLWGWHLPVLYGAALRVHMMHDLQHLFFMVAAILFWRPLLDPLSRHRLGGGSAVIYLFTTTLHSTVLGVFMTIAPGAWYPEYFGRSELWGLSPLEDQQIAGLIMWMPACLSYAVVAVYLFTRLIQSTAESGVRYGLSGRAVQ